MTHMYVHVDYCVCELYVTHVHGHVSHVQLPYMVINVCVHTRESHTGTFTCGSYSCVEGTFTCGTYSHVEGNSHVEGAFTCGSYSRVEGTFTCGSYSRV